MCNLLLIYYFTSNYYLPQIIQYDLQPTVCLVLLLLINVN